MDVMANVQKVNLSKLSRFHDLLAIFFPYLKATAGLDDVILSFTCIQTMHLSRTLRGRGVLKRCPQNTPQSILHPNYRNTWIPSGLPTATKICLKNLSTSTFAQVFPPWQNTQLCSVRWLNRRKNGNAAAQQRCREGPSTFAIKIWRGRPAHPSTSSGLNWKWA